MGQYKVAGLPNADHAGTANGPVCRAHGSDRQRYHVEEKLEVRTFHRRGQTANKATLVEQNLHGSPATSQAAERQGRQQSSKIPFKAYNNQSKARLLEKGGSNNHQGSKIHQYTIPKTTQPHPKEYQAQTQSQQHHQSKRRDVERTGSQESMDRLLGGTGQLAGPTNS